MAKESNGDVISGLARPSNGRNSNFAIFSWRKTAYTVERVQDRWKNVTGTRVGNHGRSINW
jgi:hypothetical protein